MNDELHEALLDLTGLLNRSEPDALLLRRAGASLDRALLPLLSRAGSQGPLSIDELANLAGRDHSTVSRQVAKLESLGLVVRRMSQADQRRREVEPTKQGRRLLTEIGEARDRMLEVVFQDWSAEDRSQLTKLMRRFVECGRSSLQ